MTSSNDELASEKARPAWSYTPESRLVVKILEEYERRAKNDKTRKAG